MTTYLLGWIGMPEALLIMVVLLVFFGAKRLPELAKGLGTGIREFKKATNEVTQDITRAMDEPPSPPPAPKQIQKPAEPEPAPHSSEPKA
jgi:sec-independent protein translocase protein TatA